MSNKTLTHPTASDPIGAQKYADIVYETLPSELAKLFSEPGSGVPFEVHDEQDEFLCKLLVSARLREEEEPFPKILAVIPYEKVSPINDSTRGLLLIEARDAAEPANGNVAHMAVAVEAGTAKLLEIDVRPSHRGMRIPEVILALAWKLTGAPVGPDAHDPYPAL